MIYCGFFFHLSDDNNAKSDCHQTSPIRAWETFFLLEKLLKNKVLCSDNIEMRKAVLWCWSGEWWVLWGVQPIWHKDPFPIAHSHFRCNWNKLQGQPTVDIQQMSLIFVFLKWQILWMNTLSMKLRSSWSPWPCWSLRAGHQSTQSRAGQRASTAPQHSQVSHHQLSMNAATKWLRYGAGTHFISQILATVVKVSQEPHSGFTVKHK